MGSKGLEPLCFAARGSKPRVSANSTNSPYLAAEAGLEPANLRVKAACLATWLLGIKEVRSFRAAKARH